MSMSGFVDALRAGFGVLSTIPVKCSGADVDVLSKHMFAFVFVGAVLGALIGCAGAVAHLFLPETATPLMPLAVMGAIYFVCGLNHLDGLSDVGDGMTAHGPREKKVGAMKDTSIGVGGVGYVVLYLIALYAVLFTLVESVSPLMLAALLMVSEVCAKHAMVGVAAMGTPLHEGLGSVFVGHTRLSAFLISIVLSVLIGAFFVGVVGIIAVLVATLTSAIVVHRASAHFGGVSGDVLGASNELGRLMALLCMGVFVAMGGGAWRLL